MHVVGLRFICANDDLDGLDCEVPGKVSMTSKLVMVPAYESPFS